MKNSRAYRVTLLLLILTFSTFFLNGQEYRISSDSSLLLPAGQFMVTFDDYPDGQHYTKDMALKDFGRVLWFNNPERMSIDENNLTVLYPGGNYGNERTGAEFEIQVIPENEYLLVYMIKFHKGFDFNATGGILPGLAGGKANTSKNYPVGDGWSTRLKWSKGGRAYLYAYHMDQPSDFGESFDLAFTFEHDTWYTITQRVKVNTDNKNNGETEIYINGEKKFEKHDFKFMINNQAPVDIFYFSTYINATNESDALKTSGYISFDNISLHKNESAQPTKIPSYPKWDKEVQYRTGDIVAHNNAIWQAKWWTKNEEPIINSWNPWNLLEEVTPTSTPVPESTPVEYMNIARDKKVTASSQSGILTSANHIVDGDMGTYWESTYNERPEYVYVDLGKPEEIAGVIIKWNDPYFASRYKLAISNDAKEWFFAFEQNESDGDEDIIIGETTCRYVGIYCTDSNGDAPFAIKELEIYKKVIE